MNGRFVLGAALLLGVGLLASAAFWGSQAPKKDPPAPPAPAPAAPPAGGASGQEAASPSAPGPVERPPPTTPSQIEYDELRRKYAGAVLHGGQKAKQEKARRMVDDFQKFIDKYPETEEALDAMHLMGVNYQAELILNQPEKAIEIWKRMRGVARKLGKTEQEVSALRMLSFTWREMNRDDDELAAHREILALPLSEEDKKQVQARIHALENLRVGKKPIPFPPTVADLEGNPISLDDLTGKIVLIDFWSSEVPQCLGDLEYKKEAYKKFKDRGFEIISISLEMERPALKNILEDYRVTWPQYFNKKCPGWNNDLLQLYTVHRIPMTFLIDRKGIMRYKNPPGGDLPVLVQKLVEEP